MVNLTLQNFLYGAKLTELKIDRWEVDHQKLTKKILGVCLMKKHCTNICSCAGLSNRVAYHVGLKTDKSSEDRNTFEKFIPLMRWNPLAVEAVKAQGGTSQGNVVLLCETWFEVTSGLSTQLDTSNSFASIAYVFQRLLSTFESEQPGNYN